MWRLIKKYLKDNRGFWATAAMMGAGALSGAAKQKAAKQAQYSSAMSQAVGQLGAPVAGSTSGSKFAAIKDSADSGMLQGLGAGMAQEQALAKAGMANKEAESNIALNDAKIAASNKKAGIEAPVQEDAAPTPAGEEDGGWWSGLKKKVSDYSLLGDIGK